MHESGARNGICSVRGSSMPLHSLHGWWRHDDRILNVIQGGGGCLLHEKIVAQASRREIIIIDASKPSPQLGVRWALPVEANPFGWGSQRRFLDGLGARVSARLTAMVNALVTVMDQLFKTDEGNLTLDAMPPLARSRIRSHWPALDARTGIVEHGLFVGLATDVLVTDDDIVHRKGIGPVDCNCKRLRYRRRRLPLDSLDEWRP